MGAMSCCCFYLLSQWRWISSIYYSGSPCSLPAQPPLSIILWGCPFLWGFWILILSCIHFKYLSVRLQLSVILVILSLLLLKNKPGLPALPASLIGYLSVPRIVLSILHSWSLIIAATRARGAEENREEAGIQGRFCLPAEPHITLREVISVKDEKDSAISFLEGNRHTQ